MRTNARIFWLLTVFYVFAASVYFYMSDLAKHDGVFKFDGQFEVIGTAAIAMLSIMTGFIAFYLQKSANAQGGIAPEDNENAKIEDGDAEIGFFAPWSWWPFFLGLFGSIVFASLAVGWWLTFIGLPLGIVALIGFVFEHSRGEWAH